MSGPPQLFDRALLRRRQARWTVPWRAPALLHARIAADLQDRLAAINRPFARVALFGDPAGALDLARPGRTLWRVGAVAGRAGAALVADEEALPFADESLDLIVSVLTLHLVNDLPGVLIQMNRALAPDGLLLAVVPGGETLGELRAVMAEAELAVAGGISPRVAPMLDIRDAGALLQRAGFALPVADSDRLTIRYPDLLTLLVDLRAAGQSNPLAARRRVPATRGLLDAADGLYRRRFADPDGRLPVTAEILTLTGWAPHESQQKPLAPGSARHRLAEAFGTRERPAGERAGRP